MTNQIIKGYFVILNEEELQGFTSETEIAVYRAIKSYLANGKQSKALSVRDIQARTLVSRGTIGNTISKLVSLGKIKIVGEEPGLGGKSPVYQLSVQPLDTSPNKVISMSSKLSVQPLPESVQSSGTKVIQRNKGIRSIPLRKRKREEAVETIWKSSPPESPGKEEVSASFFGENPQKNKNSNSFEKRKEWTNRLREIPIADICQKLSIAISKDGKVPCHGERTPSCDIGLKRKSIRYKCFGCGASGGSIDFVMLMEKLDFLAACDRLSALFGIQKPQSKKKEYPWAYVEYLEEHGLTPEQFEKFGYYSRQYRGSLAIKVETGIRYRILSVKEGGEKYRNKSGTKTCIFKTAMPINGIVFLCEGEVDAISLFTNASVAAWSLTCGALTFPDELVSHFKNISFVLILYDNDEAGIKGANLAASKLRDRSRIVRLPHGTKDIGGFFGQGGTKEDFEKLIKQAELQKNFSSDDYLKYLKQNIVPAEFRM